jgi:hypothetical protein
VLIEATGQARQRRLTVLNTRAEHDRPVELLSGLSHPVTCGFEATGNLHRPIAWRWLQAGFDVRLVSYAVRCQASALTACMPPPEPASRDDSPIGGSEVCDVAFWHYNTATLKCALCGHSGRKLVTSQMHSGECSVSGFWGQKLGTP